MAKTKTSECDLTALEIRKLRMLLNEVAFDDKGRLYFRHMPCNISKDVFDRIFKTDTE